MAFDWIAFFRQHNINYVDSGPNVSKGQIAIRCPWCGHSDPSQHLSISLEGKGYRCWRNHDHRGKSPVRLIQALIRCTYEQAAAIAGVNINIPENFYQQVQNQLAPIVSSEKRSGLKFPIEFKTFQGLPSGKPFIRYLRDERGFTEWQMVQLIKMYELRYCKLGPYKDRIIFPIIYQDEMVSWTGRTIWPDVSPRYKVLSADSEKAAFEGYPPAVGSDKDYLLGFDWLIKTDCDTIYLCEGPFDAAKVSVLGRDHGICATCFFTAAPSQKQVDLLYELLPRFKHRSLLLDQGTLSTALSIKSRLLYLDIGITELPKGMKDPAMLYEKQLLSLK